MKSLAERVILAWGWRRLALAWLAGAVGALSMPPFGFLPALAVSLTVGVWLIDGAATGRQAWATLLSTAVVGWWWGFGYFVAGLWWLGAAFLVEAEEFAWALPFGVLGLPAVLAFFPALGFVLSRFVWSAGAGRLLAFAFGMALSEWLRGFLFTGFPWNTLGMALAQNAWLLQGASLLGLYGLTLLVVLICAAPAVLGTGMSTSERVLAPSLALMALAALALFGATRLPGGPVAEVAGVKLRIMQPNLPQDAKFRPENGGDIMRHYLAMSDRATSPRTTGVADATHLIWPESAFPFLLHKTPWALAEIAALLPSGKTLITGAAREGEPLFPGEEGRRIYNAIQVIADDGTIVGAYDKTHLVPFGEYFPGFLDSALRSLGIRQFVHVPGGFSPGERRGGFVVPGLPPVAATICYEAIFPGAVVGAGARPGLILNVTNDAWFGNTPGPHQHFAQARVRAVEEGLPLVRAANSGISAVVDPYGRVLGSLSLGAEGVLDAALPQAIAPPVFARYGNALVISLILCCAFAAGVAHSKGR